MKGFALKWPRGGPGPRGQRVKEAGGTILVGKGGLFFGGPKNTIHPEQVIMKGNK